MCGEKQRKGSPSFITDAPMKDKCLNIFGHLFAHLLKGDDLSCPILLSYCESYIGNVLNFLENHEELFFSMCICIYACI